MDCPALASCGGDTSPTYKLLNAIHYAPEGAPTYLHGLLDLFVISSAFAVMRGRASEGLTLLRGAKKFYFMMYYLLVNFPTATVFVVRRGRAREG